MKKPLLSMIVLAIMLMVGLGTVHAVDEPASRPEEAVLTDVPIERVTIDPIYMVSTDTVTVPLYATTREKFNGFNLYLGYDPRFIEITAITDMSKSTIRPFYRGVLALNPKVDPNAMDSIDETTKGILKKNLERGLDTSLITGVSSEEYENDIALCAITIQARAPGTTSIIIGSRNPSSAEQESVSVTHILILKK